MLAASHTGTGQFLRRLYTSVTRERDMLQHNLGAVRGRAATVRFSNSNKQRVELPNLETQCTGLQQDKAALATQRDEWKGRYESLEKSSAQRHANLQAQLNEANATSLRFETQLNEERAEGKRRKVDSTSTMKRLQGQLDQARALVPAKFDDCELRRRYNYRDEQDAMVWDDVVEGTKEMSKYFQS